MPYGQNMQLYFPNYAQATQAGLGIRGARLQNQLYEQKLADYPRQQAFLQQQQELSIAGARQEIDLNQLRAEAIEQSLKTGTFEEDKREAEAMFRLMSGVSDQQSWITALSMFGKMFGQDKIKDFPKEYQPQAVEALQAVAAGYLTSGQKEREQQFVERTIYGPGGKTKMVSIPKGESYEPETKWSLAEPPKPPKPTAGLPDEIEAAWKVVAKFSAGQDPIQLALLSTVNKELANSVGQGVPEAVRPLFNRSLEILNRHFNVPVQPPPAPAPPAPAVEPAAKPEPAPRKPRYFARDAEGKIRIYNHEKKQWDYYQP